jgi:chromosome segregation ATPase
MRTQFEDKLGQLEAAMSGMKELQASSGKISALQAEQAELKETVGSLERLLKQRDDELSGLTAQLQAVRAREQASYLLIIRTADCDLPGTVQHQKLMVLSVSLCSTV